MALRLVVRHPNSESGEAGEIQFEFEQVRVVLGRSAGADVRLPDLTVSDSHATIEREGDSYGVRDEGSTNGTRVNGKPLVPGRPRVLLDGDEIGIAQFTLQFTAGSLQRGTTLPERTASLARRMMRELLGTEHAAHEPPFLRAMVGGELLQLGEPPARLLLGELEDGEQGPAELVRDPDGTLARAVDARGIEVNGKRVRERRLRHGDVLRAGSAVVIYQDFAEQALRELERQQDATYREPPTVPLVAPVEDEPELEAPVPPSDPPASTPVDLVIYGLAAIVLAASVVGLLWLFR
ncbi:MAG TPA: FHA domain-containing protein [Polyangiales bacterium]|nr:FHA domain-containing protein [Polyangiales bacterium]